jgi:hypothetical protein
MHRIVEARCLSVSFAPPYQTMKSQSANGLGSGIAHLPNGDANSSSVIGYLRHGVLLVFSAPCQLRLLAGQEHGRTIPLTDVSPYLMSWWRSRFSPYQNVRLTRYDAFSERFRGRRASAEIRLGSGSVEPYFQFIIDCVIRISGN